MIDLEEAQTPEEELTESGPEDAISATHIVRTAKLIKTLFANLRRENIEVYFDADYIRVFHTVDDDGAFELIALLAYT